MALSIGWEATFHTIAKKIDLLTRALSAKKFYFNAPEREVFEDLKETINNDTFRYHIDDQKPLYLQTDASTDSYGAILYQIKSYNKKDLPELQQQLSEQLGEVDRHPVLPTAGKGVPKTYKISKIAYETDTYDINKLVKEKDFVHVVRVVAFHSCLFRGAQAHYGILEKEMYSIFHSLKHFKDHLFAVPATYLITDSQPLLWLMKFRNLGISKLERMIVQITSLPFKIIVSHVAGKVNVADCLTRWAWKVPEVTTSREARRNAFIVQVPFPIGKLVSLQDIIQKLQDTPDLVSIGKVRATPAHRTLPRIIEEADPIMTIARSSEIVTLERLYHEALARNVKSVNVFSPLQDLYESLSIKNIVKEQGLDDNLKPLIEQAKFDAEEKGQYYLYKGVLLRRRDKKDSLEDGQIVVPTKLIGHVLAFFHFQHTHWQ